MIFEPNLPIQNISSWKQKKWTYHSVLHILQYMFVWLHNTTTILMSLSQRSQRQYSFLIFAFVCNAKSFASAIPVFCVCVQHKKLCNLFIYFFSLFFFSFLPLFLDRLVKNFSQWSICHYPWHKWPRLDLLPWVHWFDWVYLLLVVIPDMAGQYLFNMRVELIQRPRTAHHALLVKPFAWNSSFLCQLCCSQKSFITPNSCNS